ncbi:hypothetical protein A2574_01580 [Candidatus Shapirobacteria bacterium RIFOXYD1_FULL_38_32]|nr:MAG: hypothetical protein A2410_03735 [Candidatus Shapirobacteria bacterium RIFOXYC1_FULL_38_24]OGL58020.1 MAG: hypothetical protein A2574_01580 [Candidatus Shapirobacteria bacterium RIFOXYD1_FULL_38_32]HCU55696.1 hypothetical protein [Candidatus Shapirobacteria bacterium]
MYGRDSIPAPFYPPHRRTGGIPFPPHFHFRADIEIRPYTSRPFPSGLARPFLSSKILYT